MCVKTTTINIQKLMSSRIMDSQPKVLTAEAIADLEIPTSVMISPSGTQVAYSVNSVANKAQYRTTSVWVAEVGKEHSARQLTSGLDNDVSPQWSSDGEFIAFISDRTALGSSAIYLISLKGGEAFPITKRDNRRRISNMQWSPNGKYIAYLSADEKTAEKKAKEEEGDDAIVYGEDWQYDRLRYIHVATREITTLYAKEAHVNDFAWNRESNEIAYVLHPNPETDSGATGVDIERIHLSTREINKICHFPGGVWGPVWRKNELFFVSGLQPSKITSSNTVYKVSIDDHNWTEMGFGVTNDVGGIWPSGDSIWINLLCGLRSQIRLLDGDEVLWDDERDIGAWDVVGTEGGNVMAIGKSSINSPQEIYSWKDGELCQLSNHGGAISGLEIGTERTFSCTATDGTELNGVFMTPIKPKKEGETEEPAKPWPTFVQPHGGPYVQSTLAFDPSGCHWAPWLTSAGYAVLAPNYRGSSGRGDKFASVAGGGLGTLDYDDIICMVKAGIAEGLIDEKHVMIGGWSQGGYLSFLAVTRPDFQFRGAICGAGMSDLDMMPMTGDVPVYESEFAGKAPWEEGALESQNRRGSPIWHMKDIKTPLLILHGEQDSRVPVDQSRAFHRGCLYHKIPCKMVIYPGEGHCLKGRMHVLDMLKRVRQFCDLHLS